MPEAFSVVVQELLESGLHVRFRAGGRSMAPAVRDGDVVTIAPVDPHQVAVGDVVLCDTWRGPLAHRVIAVDARAQPPRFVLRGDRSQQDDRPVGAGQVRGRLVAVERDGQVDRTAFAAGTWSRRLTRAREQCADALARAGRSARAAVALLRAV